MGNEINSWLVAAQVHGTVREVRTTLSSVSISIVTGVYSGIATGTLDPNKLVMHCSWSVTLGNCMTVELTMQD